MLTAVSGTEKQRAAPRAGTHVKVKKEGGRKEGGSSVMETKEGVFPGCHRASVLRAVIKASKRRREVQALDTTM